MHAIEACLGFANVRADQVDEVCFGWQTAGPVFRHDLKMYGTGQWPATYLNVLNSSRHFLSMWHQESGARVFERTFGTTKPRMRFVDHHLAHAISAYGYSGFDDAAIVVMDGRGAWEATSIWHGKNGRIEHVQTIPFPNSIGGFYSAFTEYLGFVPNSDEWKVMGLAPYGEPGVNLDAFITPETMNGTPYHVHTKRIHGGRTGAVAGIAAALGALSRGGERDRAATQEYCVRGAGLLRARDDERGAKLRCARRRARIFASRAAWRSTRRRTERFRRRASLRISLCSRRLRTMELRSARRLRLISIAADRLPSRAMRHAYFGPSFDDGAIETALKTYKLRYTHVSDPAAAAAQLLSEGKILGWFQGRMEFGPRALGGRSILADPRDPEMTAKVNNAVKFREWWRPFAPSMKRESGRRVCGKRDGFAVHDFDGASAAGKAECDSRSDARGRKRAAADGGADGKSALLAPDR